MLWIAMGQQQIVFTGQAICLTTKDIGGSLNIRLKIVDVSFLVKIGNGTNQQMGN
jgi:hypothetical protein